MVATPIGNLEDFSVRGQMTLSEVDIVLAEDTRQTKKLLNHYNIVPKKLQSYHAKSSVRTTEYFIDLLERGASIALVSDAGTPCISDPGWHLVSLARQKNISVSGIPGACAFLTALSASGFRSDRFEFLGFLPHKKGRQTLFQEISEALHTIIFYESTHRIEKCIYQAQEFFPEKKICVARELSKIYEEFLFGTAEEILSIFKSFPEKKKGEFVVLVEGGKKRVG